MVLLGTKHSFSMQKFPIQSSLFQLFVLMHMKLTIYTITVNGRYHIAGSMGVFYAREPYSNVDASHVTRFLGLGKVGNKDKQVCSV